MQTSKMRSGSSDASQKTSPHTPKSTRATKSGGTDSDSSTSKLTPTKTPTNRSLKVIERRSPRSPPTENIQKRRPTRLTELEAQLARLQEDLKKTKDQLTSSESLKKRAQQEAENVREQLQVMIEKYEDSQNQLMEFSAAEESRIHELRKISQDRDRSWEFELDALKQQHSVDSDALSSAMNEIHRLKLQLETVAQSESDQAMQSERAQTELEDIQEDIAEYLSLVGKLKIELKNREKAEAEAKAKVVETQQQLEVARTTVETYRSEGSKLMELFRSSVSELEHSKARVNLLEESVTKLQEDKVNTIVPLDPESLELEVEKLRSALEAAEANYEEEQSQIASQIRSAYEIAEKMKLEFGERESELEAALKDANAELGELKASLLDKETELQSISDLNEELKAKLENSQVNRLMPESESKLIESVADITELKANLMDMENELQGICEENEQLKIELGKREMENGKSYESTFAEMESAKAKEKEAMLKLEYITEEVDKSSQQAARMNEQLEAAKTMNSEMEAELRRLRVQSDQWRKAAEAAAAILTTGNDERFAERTGSLEADYPSVAGKLMHSPSPFSDDLDDDSPKKKNNNNVLRKFGGLWKKNPK